MTPTVVSDVLTIAGAAGIVATIVQLTKFVIDLAIKTPSLNVSVTRLYVFAVAIVICALPPLQAHGFHLKGDVLSLITVAFAVAGTAISEYHLLSLAPVTTATLAGGTQTVFSQNVASTGIPGDPKKAKVVTP